jgi:hypothetical protein
VETERQRLLDVAAAAAYLGGVSESFVHGLVREGLLVPVRIPSMRRRGEQSRRLLFDVRDISDLVDSWKRASSSQPNVQLSQAALKGWNNRRGGAFG